MAVFAAPFAAAGVAGVSLYALSGTYTAAANLTAGKLYGELRTIHSTQLLDLVGFTCACRES